MDVMITQGLMPTPLSLELSIGAHIGGKSKRTAELKYTQRTSFAINEPKQLRDKRGYKHRGPS
jgi:hypothetical protein